MKRTVIFAGVLALLLTPAIVTAQQTTDTATLNLTGNVPSLVRIGFGDVATQSASFDFGDLSNAPGTQTVDVTYLGNVSFSIDVQSNNGGILVNTGASGSGFQNTLGYTFTWGGTTKTLDGTGTELVATGEPRGIYTTTAQVTVTEASLDNVDETTSEANIPAAGTYEDVLTFTITADQ